MFPLPKISHFLKRLISCLIGSMLPMCCAAQFPHEHRANTCLLRWLLQSRPFLGQTLLKPTPSHTTGLWAGGSLLFFKVQFPLLCWLCESHVSPSFPKFHLIPSCQPAWLQSEHASGAWYVLGNSHHLPCCFLWRLHWRTVWPLSATEPAPFAHALYLHLISLKWLKQTFLIKC